jgi:hypothetical protein
VKVEEQVRVENNAPGAYVAQLWVSDRYFRAVGTTEDEARNALPRVIYDNHAREGVTVDPNDLPVAVRKAVADYAALMAEITRSELLKFTAHHLHFAPDIRVLSPLEVAANCIHRGADLGDTDPALLPNVLCWFHAEIVTLEHEAVCLERHGDAERAAEKQAQADALKATLAKHGFGWAYVAATDDR